MSLNNTRVSKETKHKKITIRCTTKQRQMVEEAARKQDMNVGDYMIMCVEAKGKKEDKKLLRGPIYRNICDVITAINYLPDTEENEKVKEEVRNYVHL